MNNRWQTLLAVAALICAAVAVALAYRAPQPDEAAIAALQNELAAVKSQLEAQRETITAGIDVATTLIQPAGDTSDDTVRATNPAITSEQFESVIRSVDAQLETLRNELAELRADRERPNETIAAAQSATATDAQFQVEGSHVARVAVTEQEIAALEGALHAREATIAEKLAVLRDLRAADARSAAVADHMAAAYYETEDAADRANIFRQLSGVTTEPLRKALLYAVANDAAPEVREEAAETLRDFLPDDDVQEWLMYLVEQDPDRDVQRQAGESLRGFR